jgi:hypothetical protein
VALALLTSQSQNSTFNSSKVANHDSSTDSSGSCSSESESEANIVNNGAIVLEAILKNNLTKEISEFVQILQDSKLLSKIKTSKKIWSQNEEKFPYMSKLFALTSINSSSAFIERFFSICGIINTDRNQNMKQELFEIYAMLNSNLHIIQSENNDIEENN